MTFDEHARQQYAGMAEAYERSFAPLCGHVADRLLDAAGVAGGARVLDAGTGTGTVAARAVARGASVTAIDAEPSMLAAARRRAPEAELHLAVLPRLPFPGGGFDAVVANFVVNHVGDPAAAVAELRRVVRPGGRVAVTTWPFPQPPLQRLWGDVFAAAGGHRPAGTPAVAPEKNFERTPDGLAGLLRDAGLREPQGELVEWVHRADPRDWWSGPASGLGVLGTLMRHQTPEVFARIRAEYDRAIAPYLDPDGVLAMPTAAVLAHAVA